MLEVERYKMHKKFKKAVEKHDQDLRGKLSSDLTHTASRLMKAPKVIMRKRD